jgi:acylphosphatase
VEQERIEISGKINPGFLFKISKRNNLHGYIILQSNIAILEGKRSDVDNTLNLYKTRYTEGYTTQETIYIGDITDLIKVKDYKDIKIQAYISITGHLENQSYENLIKRFADEYLIKGWVKRDQESGNINLKIEGQKYLVEKLIDWLKGGTAKINVFDIKIDYQKYTGEFKEFYISY